MVKMFSTMTRGRLEELFGMLKYTSFVLRKCTVWIGRFRESVPLNQKLGGKSYESELSKNVA